ncbi:hypothetical protein [Marilutibacter aestuarii]|uniref:Cobalamin ABC transporter n=1 Tax=Marilutibacter aestuarii TaxID=1706195 RepID=A0A508A2A2_9GAMM|nr:hypothetical protein [Lysobacter aestuarii]TQD43989.1 hypothetical protein FKV25_09775 [Lysobacter aestuarii]
MAIVNDTASSLPVASTRDQWAVGLALAALMVATRGQHFASVDALPSASWAIFFLAGALLRPMWTLPAFFVLSTVLDLGSYAAGTITDWCLSPAYWALALAYASLWLGGRVYRGLHRDGWRDIPRLAVVLLVTGSVAYLLSKGGYWFFSGRYPEPDLQGFIARIPAYYPRALGTLAGYVGAAFALRAIWRAVLRSAAMGEARS